MTVEKRLTATIVTLMLISVALTGAVGVPTVLSINHLKKNIAEESLNIEKVYATRRLTQSTENVLADIHRRLALMNAFDVVEGQELTFISALENAAADSRIKQSLQLETANQKELTPWKKEIPLKITAEGDYRDMIVYLHKIESLPFYLIVSDLRISVPKQRELADKGVVEMALTGYINWRSKDHPVFK